MKKKSQSVDGIILKRSSNQFGGLHNKPIDKSEPILKSNKHSKVKESINELIDHAETDEDLIGQDIGDTDLKRSDIDESLKNLDENKGNDKKLGRLDKSRLKKQSKKENKSKKHHSKVFKIIRAIFILVFLSGISVGGYTGYKLLSASNSVFKGNIFQIFQNVPLKEDTNGRSNFLVLGTSEDDPGHEGATLTDSIMVVSIDQKNKNAFMFSVPRDLYVDYGQACNAGYSGKINEYFNCVNSGTSAEDEQDRLSKTQSLIGGIFGLDIQYGVHVNYTVLKEAVDAVGGIDVDIQGSAGELGILDRTFDYLCNYTCNMVKYDNGVHHLDGQHALYLAQARGHEEPTYGLARSNFDREVNQQKIVIALKEKASSTGVLTDFNKIIKLVDALGGNLRTNIQTKEIRTLMDIAMKTLSADIHMLSLVGDNDMVSVLTTSDNGVVPIAGDLDYSEIQAFIAKNITSNPVIREASPIVVLNGSGQDGLAQTKADELSASGYTISYVDTAPEGTYEKIEVYQIGTGNSGTASALAKLYGVTIKTTTPPISVDDTTGFVIIFGPQPVN